MNPKKILLLLYPNCISFETMLAIDILSQQFQTDVITPNNEVHKDASGLSIMTNLDFEDIQLRHYAALLIPGGNPDEIVGLSKIRTLIQKAHQADLIIGGICAGVLVLADSGILKGQTISHNYTEQFSPKEIVDFTSHFWESTTYSSELCTKSNKIITARPNGFIDFAMMLAHSLGLYSAEHTKKMLAYYKGL